MVTKCYDRSFFCDRNIGVSTARAGNVIGGGDFATDRIIPDCVRAAMKKETIKLRNPNSIRPYQHVLEPLFAYLMIAKRQAEDTSLSGHYNVGPDEGECKTTGEIAALFCDAWQDKAKWEATDPNGPHEAGFLKLDNSLIKEKFGWRPGWDTKTAIEKTVDWYKTWATRTPRSTTLLMDRQIEGYGK